MFGQSFQLTDLPVIAFLVLLEGLLSADNALVLAIMVRHLPKELHQKALLYGLGGAFVFRFIAILVASQIIALWWLQVIGAVYLVYLPLKHFWGRHTSQGRKASTRGFWPTVLAVEVADIAFALDSVIAAVALVRAADKLWVVYTGAILGVVTLRFAAGLFIGLLERYPAFDHLAYVLVGWVGIKLGFMSAHNCAVATNRGRPENPIPIPPEMSPALFWSVMVVMIAVGTYVAVRKGGGTVEAKKKQTGVEGPV